MSNDKTIIDEIMEEIKHSKGDYEDDGTAAELSPEKQEVLDKVDAILSSDGDKKSAIVSDIEETTSKYTKTDGEATAVFERLKNPDDSPTMYFKRSRFQTKPLKFEDTGTIMFESGAGNAKVKTADNKTDSTISVPNVTKKDDKPERSFKGQSVIDGRVNNQRSRMEFSQTGEMRRRISKPGATDDVFTTATITPERKLSDTSTDDLARIFNSGKKAPESPTSDSQVVEGQIRLSGFDDETAPDKVDDEFVAEQLRNTRLRKISEFNAKKIFDVYEGEEEEAQPPEPDQIQGPDKAPEETQPQPTLPKKKGVHSTLRERYATRAIQVIALLVMGIFNALLFFLFPADGNIALYGVLNTFILIVAGVIYSHTLISGVATVINKKFTINSAIAVATLAALIQNFTFIVSDLSVADVYPYQIAVIMIMLLHSWGKLSVEERIKNNFHNLSEMPDIYAVSKIGDDDIASLLGKGIPDPNPTIVYSAKVKNISKFLQTSNEEDEFKHKYGKFSLVLIIIGFVVSILVFIMSKTFLNAITAFTALTCCSIPAAAGLCANLPLLRFSRKNRKDGVILGCGAIEQSADTNAVAVDSCSLFPRECCSLYGIKTFKSMPIDEAILLTTAALVCAENPLGAIFTTIIGGRQEILPEVEECNYEDGLGITAWIDGKRILVGNRDMMVHRGIDVLTPQNERKYTKNNRQILYLAVENVLSAMFVVGLTPDTKLTPYIKHLQDHDITLLVRSTDPNLSEQMLAHYFGAYESTFKILNGRCGELYRIFSKASHPKLAASIVHRNNPRSMFKTLSFSLRLRSMLRAAFRVNIIGAIILFALFAVSALSDVNIGISALSLIILQLVVAVLACIIPKFIKK
ncbi:MAG: cation-translocating P-type ATPase [Clostridia bacterium]|nr:cation-translocating P-type ATPase [Clostridia bacterium]